VGYRFEFDAVNRILLSRIEGAVTNQLMVEHRNRVRDYARATDAKAFILDFTLAESFEMSSDLIRQLASSAPTVDANYPRVMVVPTQLSYGLGRMFQIVSGSRRPHLTLASTLEEALASLEAKTPKFENVEIVGPDLELRIDRKIG
jgi:hypothetical protein